jgi:hypothetical protein
MAQIIKQPDGKFAIFSRDVIVMWDATGNEVVGWFVEQARVDAARAIESAERVSRKKLNDIAAGRPRQAYGQLAMSWEDALRSDRRHDGEAHRAFPALPPDPCPECGGEVDYRDDGSERCRVVGCGYELLPRE